MSPPIEQDEATHSLVMQSKSDLPSGLTPAISKPRLNWLKYLFGMKCQSTVHNHTKEVVYAVKTNKMIKTTTTKSVDGNIGFVNNEAGLKRMKQTEKGPTPPTIISISPGDCYTFNLDSRNYYLTIYTMKDNMKENVSLSSRRIFHQINVKVKGCHDYIILSRYLEHQIEIDFDDKMMKFVMNAS